MFLYKDILGSPASYVHSRGAGGSLGPGPAHAIVRLDAAATADGGKRERLHETASSQKCRTAELVEIKKNSEDK